MTPPHRIHRLEVHAKPGAPDPHAAAVRAVAAEQGLSLDDVACARVYLLEGPLTPAQLQRIADDLLADPVTQRSVPHAAPTP
ncbi:MAG: hypothetical protein ACF8NJ_04165, partial [Phycisphaerales bacterium JB038]